MDALLVVSPVLWAKRTSAAVKAHLPSDLVFGSKITLAITVTVSFSHPSCYGNLPTYPTYLEEVPKYR